MNVATIVPPPSAKNIQTDFQVLMTGNYSMFSHFDGNRNVNPKHVVRLKESMKKQYLFSPIIVNEKKQIIDGQHRFDAAKQLGLPIYYIVVRGYGLSEIHLLNSNSSNWGKIDYLQGYCDLGQKPYIQFKDFMQKYPDFGVASTFRLLAGHDKKFGRDSCTAKDFENGRLVILDIEKSYDQAKLITSYKPYYAGYHRVRFVSAALNVIEHVNYKHKEMIQKLEMQHGKLRDCSKVADYVIALEDIYNYKRVNKVNLRY
jgi:disulfide oxidoreductase YuzD